MFLNYIKKTKRADRTSDVILRAVCAIKYINKTIKQTFEDYQIPYRSLQRYCSKFTMEELEKYQTGTTPNIIVGFKKTKKVNNVN